MSDKEYLEFEDVFDSGNWTVWQYVQNSVGNWYRIPADMYEDFLMLDEDEYKELDFLEMFDQYWIPDDHEGVGKALAALSILEKQELV